jgi:hypothetical protein
MSLLPELDRMKAQAEKGLELQKESLAVLREILAELRKGRP